MILWRNIEIIHFYPFDSNPNFPHFYNILGGNMGPLLYGDVSMIVKFQGNQTSDSEEHLSLLDVRKPVFGVSDLVRHKPGCTTTEGG